jgi:hypothetical protein
MIAITCPVCGRVHYNKKHSDCAPCRKWAMLIDIDGLISDFIHRRLI